MGCIKLHIIEEEFLQECGSSIPLKHNIVFDKNDSKHCISDDIGCERCYRFGFNGQENDNEIKGKGNSYTAEFWQYDSRLGRRWNVDPVDKPWMSSYHAFSNNPILNIDPNGANDDDVFYNSETGETTIVETNEEQDNIYIDGHYINSVDQGSGKKTFGDAQVVSLGDQWNTSYIYSNDAIIGLDAINFDGTSENVYGVFIERGLINLSGKGEFGFSQTFNTDILLIDGKQGYEKQRLEGNERNQSDNNLQGFYRGRTYFKPHQDAFPFDIVMKDWPQRPTCENVDWIGENSIIWSTETNRTRFNTIKYGFVIRSFIKTNIPPTYIESPSPEHILELPKGTK
jgi:RHS repeat-associated protein